MMLANRNPVVPPLFGLRRELDRLFDTVAGRDTLPFARTQAYPAMNAWEDGERLMIEAEVPGMGMEDLEITVKGNELTLKGLRRPAEGENLVYHRRERGTGEFARFLTLPFEVDADRVEATLKDGVLKIIVPKSERARPRKISVKSA